MGCPFNAGAGCYILLCVGAGPLPASGDRRRWGRHPSEPRRSKFAAGFVSKSRACMAESTSAALAAATIPTSAEITRAEKFVRERFVHEGEDPSVALALGTPRRRALDRALAELGKGAKQPS